MRPDWEVKTHSDAVRFLSRVFKHLMQGVAPLHACAAVQGEALQIVVNAQGYAVSESFKEAA
jgi:hypothetical protein